MISSYKYNYKKDFLNNGIISIKNRLSKSRCEKLYNKISNKYNWGKHIFRSEKEFKKNPSSARVNPGRNDHNLALNCNLNFIEKNKYYKKILSEILGSKYEIILKKFVVQVPEIWIPRWLKKRIQKEINPNLNKYLLPQYRDVTYFRGVDYHMDIIEHKNDNSRFITLYIYLNNVTKKRSPLNIIEKSYKYGAQKFPHSLRKIKMGEYLYNNKIFKNRLLVGKKGDSYLWSCFNLHGASRNKMKQPRISLRYKIKQKNGSNKKTLLNQLYSKVNGPLVLNKTRDDINEKNFKQIKFRKIRKSLI